MSVREQVKHWLEDNGGLEAFDDFSARVLAGKIGGVDYAPRTIRRVIGELRAEASGEGAGGAEAPGTNEEPSSAKESQADYWTASGDWYEIDDEDEVYLVQILGEPRRLPFLVVEKAIAAYVSKGGGYTQTQVTRYLWRNFNLSLGPSEVGRLFNVLGVRKSDLPIAPHQVRDGSTEENEERLHSQRLAGIEARYEAGVERRLERDLRNEVKKSLAAEALVRRVLGGVPSGSTVVVEAPAPVEFADLEPYTACIVVSDWHIGKAIDTDINRYDVGVFRERLARFKSRLYEHFAYENKRPVKRVKLLVGGDLLDGVGGEMHSGQSKGQDVHGAEQLRIAAEALAGLAVYVATITGAGVDVEAVTGNHDRVTSSRDDDPKRLGGQLLYMLAEAYTKDDPRITWRVHDSIVAVIDVESTRILLTHGDRTPKSDRDLVFMYLENAPGIRSFMVVKGHKHSFQYEDRRFIVIQCGSFCGVDDYARERIGAGSRASQVMFQITGDGPRPALYVPVD